MGVGESDRKRDSKLTFPSIDRRQGSRSQNDIVWFHFLDFFHGQKGDQTYQINFPVLIYFIYNDSEMIYLSINPFSFFLLWIHQIKTTLDESYNFLHVLKNTIRSFGEILTQLF